MRRKFKPKFHEIIYMIIPENTDDMFINENSLEYYSTSKKYLDKIGYEEMVLGLGKNVFVFDIEACEFTKEDKITREINMKELILLTMKLTKQNRKIVKKRLKQTMKKVIKPSKRAQKFLKKIGINIEED